MREDSGLILFDGDCGMCRFWVRWIMRNDPSAYFFFASLQSDAGRRVISQHGLDADKIFSVIVVDDGQVFEKSTAVLKIAGRLRFPMRLISLGRVIPRRLRDMLYDWVAANRYKWFPRGESCPLATPETAKRFLT